MRRSIARSVAAPWCAIAILLAACTGSGAATEDDQPIEQPAPKPETPAEPDTPDVPDDPNNPDNPDNPDNPGEDVPPYEGVKDVLKEILGDKYEAISGEVSQNITLTAQTIDAVTDIFPDLKAVVEDSSKMNDAKTKVNESTDDVKKALVAQVEEKISLTKEKTDELMGSFEDLNEPNKIADPKDGNNLYISASDGYTVSLSGEFDYFDNHIKSLKGTIDIGGLKIVSHLDMGDRVLVASSSLKKEIYENLNLEDKNDENSLPTLEFGLTHDKDLGLKHFLDIYDKYNKSEKLNIDAFFGSIDGRKLVDVENYTLFENDGNTAKEHDNSSIKSFEINKLIDFAKKYNISYISNLIIYGDAREDTVNWNFSNIIFEGNMSKLKNESTRSLIGIVYFKDLPYNNITTTYGQGVDGIVKLKNLSASFILNPNDRSIIDIREVNDKDIINYNPEQLIVSRMRGMYFNENVEYLKDNILGA